jgi:hypothetical protein
MEPEDREEDRSLLMALEADAAQRLQFPWDKSLSSDLLDNLGRHVPDWPFGTPRAVRVSTRDKVNRGFDGKPTGGPA